MNYSLERKIYQWVCGTGFLTEDQIDNARDIQTTTKESLHAIFLRLKYIPDKKTDQIIKNQLGINVQHIENMHIQDQIITKVLPKIAHYHRIIPIGEKNRRLQLITSDLYNFLSIAFYTQETSMQCDLLLVDDAQIDFYLKKYYGIENFESDVTDKTIEDLNLEFPDIGEETDQEREEETPIIKLVQLIITDAIKQKASDIHIEPLENRLRLRYRIDGVLHEFKNPPKKLQNSIISRIKIMANMDISEKRFPQDGRIKLASASRQIDLRVSTLPAIYGESIVMRILDRANFNLDLRDLGFSESDMQLYEEIMKIPNGIILDTGPTGSGKTTTLYATLNHLNTMGRKIITIEDPIEYQLSGINQVQVKSSIGMTFAEGLKSMLRQAPDIIMIGEIRDYETAQIAIQSALTGHLVISTLHTNDAPSAVTRLTDMGVKPYLIASSLRCVIAQRLIRSICPQCKTVYQARNEEQILLKKVLGSSFKGSDFSVGKGCPECRETGYKGRKGIFEILMIDDNIREIISKKGTLQEVSREAKKSGMHTLREDGIAKAAKGQTTISEVLRVS